MHVEPGERDLERVMSEFHAGSCDILVTTGLPAQYFPQDDCHQQGDNRMVSELMGWQAGGSEEKNVHIVAMNGDQICRCTEAPNTSVGEVKEQVSSLIKTPSAMLSLCPVNVDHL